jgi:class 3 adenylate cyclase
MSTPPPSPSSADAAYRSQYALLAKLRHDLRTPINAIIGYSEILIEDAQDAHNAEALPDLQKIHAAGKTLLAIVNETLASEKILAGQFEEDIESVAAELHYRLRTSTDAILGYSELLLEDARGAGNAGMITDLEKIHAAAETFLNAIQDIVSLSLVGTLRVEFDEKSAAAGALVEQAVQTLRPPEAALLPPRERGIILIVDDSPVNLDILAQRLARQGHTVLVAANGAQALQLASSNPLDLILLDILMPGLNGFQVLQKLKGDHRLRDLPVIMISALDELDSVVRCIEMGAEDYLPKPFNPVLLHARISSSLEKKRLRDRQRELFGKFATREVVDELMTSGFALGGKYVEATAMFSDIRSFTTIAEAQSPADTIALLNSYFGHVMEAIGSEGGIVNQMVGDGIMAIFGAPLPRADHRARAVRAALKMIERIELFNQEQLAAGKLPIQIGIGIASGPVIAGYTGSEMRATYTCVGDTVNLAARLEAHTKVVGQPILIDDATRSALDDTFRVVEQGSVTLKGKLQPVKVFSVAITAS